MKRRLSSEQSKCQGQKGMTITCCPGSSKSFWWPFIQDKTDWTVICTASWSWHPHQPAPVVKMTRLQSMFYKDAHFTKLQEKMCGLSAVPWQPNSMAASKSWRRWLTSSLKRPQSWSLQMPRRRSTLQQTAKASHSLHLNSVAFGSRHSTTAETINRPFAGRKLFLPVFLIAFLHRGWSVLRIQRPEVRSHQCTLVALDHQPVNTHIDLDQQVSTCTVSSTFHKQVILDHLSVNMRLENLTFSQFKILNVW